MKLFCNKLNFVVFFLCLFSQFSAASPSFPIKLENKTQILGDDQVYIAIKAMQDDKDCMMQFNDGKTGACIPVNKDSDLAKFNYRLSELNDVLLLPYSYSGRIYFSMAYPIRLHVDPFSGKIVDPDGFNPRDTNYYTLYDKVEYSFNEYGTWMNPTAVDFFSIPIRVVQPGSTSDVTATGINKSRSDIVNQIWTELKAKDNTSTRAWMNLVLKFDKTILRYMAPAKAMVTIPNVTPFDPNYLDNPGVYGFSYTDYLWDYYTTRKLGVDCSELKGIMPLNDYIFTGSTVGDNFIFTNADKSYTVVLEKPQDSIPFFAGAVGPFDAENNTPKAIIVREFTSAFEVGLLPAEDGAILSKTFFNAHRKDYFTSDPYIKPFPEQGPWYDLYSASLHSFGDDNPIYTFAYDDALGQDGTLHDPSGQSPTQATITLMDLSGTVVPNPYEDSTIYTVMPILGENTTVTYNGKALESNQPITGVSIPFSVVMNGVAMDIYIDPQMVIPYSQNSDGVVINKTSDAKATIIFPSTSN